MFRTRRAACWRRELRRYAWECQTQEGGWGLDSVLREQSWKLRGIVNGIDYSEWSPQVCCCDTRRPESLQSCHIKELLVIYDLGKQTLV